VVAHNPLNGHGSMDNLMHTLRRRKLPRKSLHDGFSLIEVAIVLIILALLLGSLLPALSIQVEQSERKKSTRNPRSGEGSADWVRDDQWTTHMSGLSRQHRLVCLRYSQ